MEWGVYGVPPSLCGVQADRGREERGVSHYSHHGEDVTVRQSWSGEGKSRSQLPPTTEEVPPRATVVVSCACVCVCVCVCVGGCGCGCGCGWVRVCVCVCMHVWVWLCVSAEEILWHCIIPSNVCHSIGLDSTTPVHSV